MEVCRVLKASLCHQHLASVCKSERQMRKKFAVLCKQGNVKCLNCRYTKQVTLAFTFVYPRRSHYCKICL